MVQARLTPFRKRIIRYLYKNTNVSVYDLVQEFGFSRQTITALVRDIKKKDDADILVEEVTLDNTKGSALSDKVRKSILKDYRKGLVSVADLAKKHGVSKTTIYSIVNK